MTPTEAEAKPDKKKADEASVDKTKPVSLKGDVSCMLAADMLKMGMTQAQITAPLTAPSTQVS